MVDEKPEGMGRGRHDLNTTTGVDAAISFALFMALWSSSLLPPLAVPRIDAISPVCTGNFSVEEEARERLL